LTISMETMSEMGIMVLSRTMYVHQMRKESVLVGYDEKTMYELLFVLLLFRKTPSSMAKMRHITICRIRMMPKI